MKKAISIMLSAVCVICFNISIYATESSKIDISPMNQKFIDYLNAPSLYSSDSKTGYIPQPYELPYVEKYKNYDLPTRYNVPPNYNLQTPKEFISPIKDQGDDGVCWAFSSVGVLESSLLKQNGLTKLDAYDFSENHMRYALSSEGNNDLGFVRKHDDGGNFKMALSYLTRSEINGPVLETNDRYAYNQPIRDVSVTSSISPENYYVTKAITLADLPDKYTQQQKENRINEIKQLVLDYGSVTMSYYSDSNYYDNYYQPTNYYYNGNVNGTNHAVAIVGWDDNYSKNNFKHTPPNDGAFLIKNSWGTRGELNGYFYLSYDDKFAVSDINTIVSVENRDFYDSIYEYDPFGNCGGSVGFEDYKNAYANVFKSRSQNELLTAISTNTVVPNCYLKFFISDDGSFKNLKEIEIQDYHKETDKGYQIEYTGYITFKLKSPIEILNDKFAIAIEVYNENYTQVPLTIPMERNTNGYLLKATQNIGESFMAPDIASLKSNSNVCDLAETYNANACIKAFTKSNTSEKSYNINIDSNITGGIIKTDVLTATFGTEVIVTVEANENMRLKEESLKYNDGTNDYTITNNKFTMPEHDVTIYAEFERLSPKAVTIKITTATEDAQIYYTLDGTIPTKQSLSYVDEIQKSLDEIQDTFTVKAIAVKDGFDDSDIAIKTVPINLRSSYNKDKEIQNLKEAIDNAKAVLKKAEDGNVTIDELINAISSISSAIVNYSKVSTPVITVDFIY